MISKGIVVRSSQADGEGISKGSVLSFPDGIVDFFQNNYQKTFKVISESIIKRC